jgi:hypothetical protein
MRDSVLSRKWATGAAMRLLMTEFSSEAGRSQQEAMMARIESLERRVAELEELERKREREWEAACERWLCVAAAEMDGRWGG